MDGSDRSEPSGIRRVPLTPDGYDRRWDDLAAAGAEVHGEVDLVAALVRPTPGAVLDAGCGTGRVAIELARRGYATVGVDVDPALLDRARAKAPELEWHLGDLAALPVDTAPGPFTAVVLAGNVMIFVARGTEAAVLENLASRLAPGGLLIAGFQLTGRLTLDEFDASAAAAGLAPVDRFATWDRDPFTGSGDYVVTVDSKR
ncbi:MAG TPA: class I SAM-dependent methyltransferase [Acidimicrobiia bacterium]|jgi:SAM-dependent methyltransferase